MTGTLIYKTINFQHGFPSEQKKLIQNILDKKACLVVITGDSIEITKDEFINPLNYHGDTPIYLITGSGYQIFVFEKGHLRELYKGAIISLDDRQKILSEIISILSTFFKIPLLLSETEEQILLSLEGGCMPLHTKIPHLNTKIFLEIRPNKIAFSFPLPLNDVARGIVKPLLDQIQYDPVVQQISNDHHIYLSRMDNCLDIITHLKNHGIWEFLALDCVQSLDMDHKHILILGDSYNDLPMFTYPFKPDQNVIRIFVGDNDALFF